MIVVFGATGQTGGEVTRQLAAQGVPTRALVHNPEKARRLEGLNVEIVQADLARPETLEVALTGADKAYFVASGAAIQLSENVYTAAQRAGVRHIVRLSGSFLVSLHAPVQLDQWHAQAEQALERSGIAYTHLRPSFFMQNLLFLGASGTLALPLADARVNLVDYRDIAAVAVAALTSAGHEGQTYAITGPQALRFTEVAAKLTAAAGRTFTYVPVSETEFAQRLIQSGRPAPLAADLAKEYALIGAGYPAFGVVTDTVPRLTGQPARSLDQFAHDYAQALATPPQQS
jgi:uncharacterized protein YbjT (DUF2867 family)